MKNRISKTRLCLSLLLCSQLLTPFGLRANPVGEQVVAGQASFDRSKPGALTIRQGSDRAIINWQDFSIGAGDTTNFLQPSAHSAALNRVISGNPSSLLGTLNS